MHPIIVVTEQSRRGYGQMKFNIEARFFYQGQMLAHVSSPDSFNHGFDD